LTASRPNPDVISKRLDGGVVLVHISTSRIFELNETGSAIWELLQSGCEPTEIPSRLTKAFAVEQSEAANEVRRLIDQLGAEGLLL
jgi:hypothetical protein